MKSTRRQLLVTLAALALGIATLIYNGPLPTEPFELSVMRADANQLRRYVAWSLVSGDRLNKWLFICVDSDIAPSVAALIEAGAEVNVRNAATGCMPLHRCLRHKIQEASDDDWQSTAEVLILHGADVNAVDADGHTPLYCAKRNRNLVVAQLLLNHGAKE